MSKGLEALSDVREVYKFEYCNTKDLDIIEKELKALEIIKDKRVDMWHLMDMLEQDYEMYLAFCKSEKYADCYILTQDEFDLLKEALKTKGKLE